MYTYIIGTARLSIRLHLQANYIIRNVSISPLVTIPQTILKTDNIPLFTSMFSFAHLHLLVSLLPYQWLPLAPFKRNALWPYTWADCQIYPWREIYSFHHAKGLNISRSKLATEFVFSTFSDIRIFVSESLCTGFWWLVEVVMEMIFSFSFFILTY